MLLLHFVEDQVKAPRHSEEEKIIIILHIWGGFPWLDLVTSKNCCKVFFPTYEHKRGGNLNMTLREGVTWDALWIFCKQEGLCLTINFVIMRPFKHYMMHEKFEFSVLEIKKDKRRKVNLNRAMLQK